MFSSFLNNFKIYNSSKISYISPETFDRFDIACIQGDIIKVKKMLSDYPNILSHEPIYVNNYHIFTTTCYRSKIEIAEFLFSLKPDIILEEDFQEFFDNSVNITNKNFNLCLAQWLLKIKPNLNTNMINEHLFIRLCCNNLNIKFLQWLLKIKPELNIFNYIDTNQHAFVEACRRGSIDIAKWLLCINPKLTDNDFDNAFMATNKICDYKNKKNLIIAKWLISIKPNRYIYKLKSGQEICEIRNAKEIKWLDRMVPILAFNSKNYNNFKKINYDALRLICSFI